jgi:hypothetical protein
MENNSCLYQAGLKQSDTAQALVLVHEEHTQMSIQQKSNHRASERDAIDEPRAGRQHWGASAASASRSPAVSAHVRRRRGRDE